MPTKSKQLSSKKPSRVWTGAAFEATVWRLFIDPSSNSMGWALFLGADLKKFGELKLTNKESKESRITRMGVMANKVRLLWQDELAVLLDKNLIEEVHFENIPRGAYVNVTAILYTIAVTIMLLSQRAKNFYESENGVPIRSWQVFCGWTKVEGSKEICTGALLETYKQQGAGIDALAAIGQGLWHLAGRPTGERLKELKNEQTPAAIERRAADLKREYLEPIGSPTDTTSPGKCKRKPRTRKIGGSLLAPRTAVTADPVKTSNGVVTGVDVVAGRPDSVVPRVEPNPVPVAELPSDSGNAGSISADQEQSRQSSRRRPAVKSSAAANHSAAVAEVVVPPKEIIPPTNKVLTSPTVVSYDDLLGLPKE